MHVVPRKLGNNFRKWSRNRLTNKLEKWSEYASLISPDQLLVRLTFHQAFSLGLLEAKLPTRHELPCMYWNDHPWTPPRPSSSATRAFLQSIDLSHGFSSILSFDSLCLIEFPFQHLKPCKSRDGIEGRGDRSRDWSLNRGDMEEASSFTLHFLFPNVAIKMKLWKQMNWIDYICLL